MSEEKDWVDYTTWYNSIEWQEVIKPALEADRDSLQRMLMLMDPRDVAEVAMWQGQLRAYQSIIDRPRIAMEVRRREQEQKNAQEQQSARRREPRRPLSWARGR